MHEYTRAIQEALSSHQDPGRARDMKAYMKDHFEFYGVSSPVRSEVFSAIRKEHGLPPGSELAIWLPEMWTHEMREMQMIAMELVYRVRKEWPQNMGKWFEFMVTTRSWWDTVDYIAGTLVYHWYNQYPDAAEKHIRSWSKSDDMWLNRTAILFQLKSKESTRPELLEEFILPHLGSGEFFHQKSIGWALRQYGKFNPVWVKQFVNEHDLKPLSRREAMRIILKEENQ